MKAVILILSTLFPCLIASAQTTLRHHDALRNVKVGEPFPAYSLTTVDGNVIESPEQQGKVVVLIYVSAEQVSSERTAVDASRVVEKIASQDLRLVFVTADAVHRAYFEKFRSEAAIEAPLAFDPGRKLYAALGLIVFPSTAIVGKDGRLAHVISSRGVDYAYLLDAFIRHALGLLDNAGLDEQLKDRSFDRGSAKSLASRHRAAARLLREKGLHQSAQAELLSGLALDPDNLHIRLDLADIELASGRTAEGEEIVDQVLAIDPEHRRARLIKGIALYQGGHLLQAEAVLTQALDLNPEPARVHFYLGRVAEDRKEKDAAIAHYRQGLASLLKE
ncbi:MAG: tetratricopeptide repeat protein [Planctomycetota bacterium]